MNRLYKSKNILYRICLIFRIFLILMMIVRFFLPWIHIPGQLLVAYPIILSIYVAVKEAYRWTEEKYLQKLGEIFVIIWWSLFLIMGMLQFILDWFYPGRENFILPQEMLQVCIEVMIIFACAEFSERIFIARKKARERAKNN